MSSVCTHKISFQKRNVSTVHIHRISFQERNVSSVCTHRISFREGNMSSVCTHRISFREGNMSTVCTHRISFQERSVSRILYKVSPLYSPCMFSFRKIPGNSQDLARKRPQMDGQLGQAAESECRPFISVHQSHVLTTNSYCNAQDRGFKW